jgi:RNA polymerase sigma factor (sigma-70 family)
MIDTAPLSKTTVDELILSMIEPVRAMAHMYQHPQPGFSAEDLFSVGMVEVVSVAKAKFPTTTVDLRPYLAQVARWTIIDQYLLGHGDSMRRPKKQADGFAILSLDQGEDEETLASTLSTPDRILAQDRDFSALYDAIERLPEKCRQAICMRFGLLGHGAHRNREIATLLGISPRVVGSRIVRGLSLLRKHTELLDHRKKSS